MSNELVKTSFDLAQPEQAMQVASILQKFVTDKKLTANIKGKNYPLVEAWQFAGSQLGLYPILISTEKIFNPTVDNTEIKYSATVEIRKLADDKIMSRGVAICSNKEASKRQFDEYAILSMAQTRAEGKAYRMLLSWLMKAAGFEATPAEEMDFTNRKDADDLLFSWEQEINNCKTKNDLLTLYNGNKETVNASVEIKELFKKREKQVA